MSQITKRALKTSLKNLLLQKPLNKITISDIANDCGINQMTFYYHFNMTKRRRDGSSKRQALLSRCLTLLTNMGFLFFRIVL